MVMLITTLISNLERIKSKHGDLEIRGYGHNSDYMSPLEEVNVKEFDDCDDHFVELDCDLRY